MTASQFSQPVWIRRFARIALLAGVFATGVWADLLRNRTPDFFDPQTAIVSLFFAWVVADLMQPAMLRLVTEPTPRSLSRMAVLGVAFVALAHALPSFLVGIIQAPFGGLAMLGSVIEGLFFTLRQAAVPSIVCGAIAGVVCGLLLRRAG
jgi:multidrug transporter EmrE-like cation transporter